ncbi:hypothetical protein OTU49_012815 [Cherax quadricarinatus]|uniref:Uncharacterized protein n=2 Tax=Cherax quadricarinatus TaxID=27406 RepID=A0AAW0VWE1_CHEQU
MGIHRRESSRSSGRRKITEPLRAERGKSPRNSQRRQHSSKLRGVGGDGGKSNEAVQNDGELALSSLGKDHVSAYQSELDTLKRRINKLEAEVALQGDQLQAEESLRKQLDEDLSSIRTERQELAMRVRESERIANDHRQEVKLLQEKVRLIQSMNQELSEKLQELSVAAIVG